MGRRVADHILVNGFEHGTATIRPSVSFAAKEGE